MKSDNIQNLITIFKESNDWVSANKLAKILHVSQRTIRNYIKNINDHENFSIISCEKGYRLEVTNRTTDDISFDYPKERSNNILYKLLSYKNGISLFDLADELQVSESTIMYDINHKLKDFVRNYSIEIITHDYIISLKGNEQDKRKLIGYIATHNSNGYFSSMETLSKLSVDIDVQQVSDNLIKFCEQSNLFINSYAMNNLLVHLIIIFIRLQSNNILTQTNEFNVDKLLTNTFQKNQMLDFVNQITKFYEKIHNKKMPTTDYNQIILLVSLSVEHFQNNDIDINEFTNFIDKELFNFVVDIIMDVSERYALPEFDNEFLYQFSLHIHNLTQRAAYKISYPNPLALQIKKDHAPIYDMAVFFAHQFTKKYKIQISEDEIGFIAFHLGSQIENQIERERVTCIVVTEDYHSTTRKLLHELRLSLGEELTLLDVIPFSQYTKIKYDVELIISTTKFDYCHKHYIFINPIITKQNIMDIYNEINIIKQYRKKVQTISFLNYMFRKDLFIRNVYKDSVEEYINELGNICLQKGLIEDDFINDVLTRESLSSTAFTDYIAIPHSISQYAKKSFICVLHNDSPIIWNNKNVHFVFMIGIANGDMKYFRDVFDIIVDAFSSTEKSLLFFETKTFEEFIDILTPK